MEPTTNHIADMTDIKIYGMVKTEENKEDQWSDDQVGTTTPPSRDRSPPSLSHTGVRNLYDLDRNRWVVSVQVFVFVYVHC